MPLVCTIHQPSSVLFEYFDRLLLLARGGKTVYFGDIGEKSATLTGYFEKNGVRKCQEEENPAEYILEAIGAGVSGHSTTDWPEVWNTSEEHGGVQAELERLSNTRKPDDGQVPKEFATSMWYQFVQLYIRMNVVFWRSPDYNAGRIVKSLFVGLVIGGSPFLISSISDPGRFLFLGSGHFFFRSPTESLGYLPHSYPWYHAHCISSAAVYDAERAVQEGLLFQVLLLVSLLPVDDCGRTTLPYDRRHALCRHELLVCRFRFYRL